MRIRTSLLLLILCFPAALLAAPRPTDLEIVALVEANMRATQTGDLEALLETIHPDSLATPQMEGALQALASYKLTFEAPSVQFVGMSGEYALIRVLQRTVRVAGPDFLDNEIDGIWALRLDGETWKYWTQMNLAMRSLAPASANADADDQQP